MKIFWGLVLLSMGFGGLAPAQSWDTSGNNLLNGTYYFRHVVWVPNANNLNLRDAASFDGTVSFNGNGSYTVNATVFDSINRSAQAYQATGTYSIGASGHGFLSSPASSYLASLLGSANSDSIYGLVAQGIFVGSSTENQSGYSDLFVAMPAGAALPTNATFNGTYALAELDHPTGNPLDARDSLIRLNAGGNGNLTSISATSYLGGSVSPVSQSIQNMQYSVNNTGLLIDTRGIVADSILTPRIYALHISSDGNFVFGGAPDGWDMVVGVRAATSGTPNYSGIYYQAGLDADLSQLANGVANTASFFGSLDAIPSLSVILEHQRRVSKARSVYDFTFDDAYLFNADASYDDALLSRHYIFSSNGAIRIGTGTGSSLGLSIALQSPASTGTGVYIDPKGITNSGSTGLFTSRIAPGEYLTIYGTSGSTFSPQFLYDPTFPLTLGNVQVRINNRLAPILSLDPASNSVTVVVPYATTEPIASIQLTYNGTQSNTVTVFTSATAPGVLTRPPGGFYEAAARRATDATIINPSNPARIGEFVSVYLTGLGAVNPPVGDNTPAVSSEPYNRPTHDFKVLVDGVESTPLQFVGLTPTVVGLGVINVLVPNGVRTGQDVTVEVRGPDAYTAQALLSIAPETGTATVAATSGGDQSTAITTAFAAKLVATVRDSGGNPLSGVTVTFTPVGSGASGAFLGVANTATTNAAGVATSAPITANGIIGSFKVVASAPGARSAVFNLTNAPRIPASITATSGTPQSAPINTTFAAPFVVTVKDSAGNAVNGVIVTFSSPGNAASGTFISGNKAVTDASGVATSDLFTANGLLGSYTVTATVAGAGTPASFALTNIAGTASVITATSGTPQTTAVSTPFLQPLVATVKDSVGNAVSGITVTFTAPASGASGTFTGGATTAITNALGVATSAAFTANATAGSYTVTASAAGVPTPVSFTLTNTNGNTPTISATGGTPQTTPINTAFAAPLAATVKDPAGNPLSGLTVTFAPPTSGASGTFAGGFNTALTNTSGVATSGVFTANGTGGSYLVTASVPGAAPTAFSLTNTGGATATISPTGGTPQTATINTAFTTRLTVTVKDSGGNPSSGLTVTFTAPASGASGTFAGGSFGGSVFTVTTNAAGVATSSVFTANGTAGGYTVTATVPGLLASAAAAFSLTNTAGSPSSITATAGTPQSTAVSTAFATRLAATVKDVGGNGISGLTVTFTAPSSGASGTFAGNVNTATTNASGVATSATFTANGNPGGYTVTAAVAGVSTPASFSLTNTTTTPSSIVTTSGAPQSATISTAYAAPLVATVKDSGGNPVSGVIVTFTPPASGASGTFAGGNTAATNASGVATSAVFTANGTAGSFTVAATVAGVATPANFALTNLAGSASSIAATGGTPQSTSVSTAFATRLAATVKDSGGNPLSGLTVTFTPPASGASGTFAGGVNTATTNASGVATAAVFTANATAGSFTVSAAVAGVATPASFALTNSLTPASITATSGTPQTTTVNAAFAAPLVVTVKDASNNPVSGVVVTFAVPASGQSGTFAGGVNTATTNAFGVATSAVFTANASTGAYIVTASVSGVATPANFSLTNVTPPDITLTGTSVGQNLEAAISFTLSQPAPAGTVAHPGLDVTLTSADPAKLLLAGRPGDAGTASLVINVAEGQATIGGIFVQGLASSGTVVVTASAANYNNGTSNITLTPSGFSLAGPAGVGGAFSVNQGSNTSLTVSAVQLDSNFNTIQAQLVRGGFSVSVPVTSSATSVGTTTSPAIISGGNSTTLSQFHAVNPGQTTLAAGVPAGFSPLAQGSSLTASVNPVSLSAANLSVGNNLVTSTQIGLAGTLPSGGLTMTVTSNNPSLILLSLTATGAGSASISFNVPQNATLSRAVFVQGLANSGTATYTASMPGFNSSTGTVTLGPSGFVIAGPQGVGQGLSTTAGSPDTTLTVTSALLDQSLNLVATMPVVAAVPVSVTSSNTAVGTITTSPVTILAGSSSASTAFHPLAAGSSVLIVATPAGYSTPAQFTSIAATVITPGIAVTDQLAIGLNLEAGGTFNLGSSAPSGGLDVTLTSNSASLLLSSTGIGAGTGTITVHIPAGSNSGSYYMQATSGSGTATYTATAPGFGSRTGTVTFTPSGAVIVGPFGLNPQFPRFLASVSGGNTPLTVYMAQLDPSTHDFANIQALAGGQSVSVGLTSSVTGVGTIASPVTINGGPASGNGVITQFTPVSQGTTIVAVVTPVGYTAANSNTSLQGSVGQ